MTLSLQNPTLPEGLRTASMSSTNHHGGQAIEFEVRCPIDTKVLSILRSFVTTLATEMGFGQEQTEQIEMAVDEAVTNVIRHAYKHLGVSPDLPADKSNTNRHTRETCALWVRLFLGEDHLRITVMDRGIGLQNTPRGASTLEEFHARGGQGGLGSYIIQHFMDEVEYAFPPEAGTILTMTKYLQRTPTATP